MSIEDLEDGMALWQEHRPQSGDDWVGIAQRFIAAGDDASKSSPLFAGLVLAMERAYTAEAALNEEQEIHGETASERDRYRQALEDIRSHAEMPDGEAWRDAYAEVADMARSALNQQQEQGGRS